MNVVMRHGATLIIVVVAGIAVGLIDRKRFNPRWLLIAALLIAMNNVLLTNFYKALPNAFAGSHWNWQGKLLALIGSVAIAALPAFGFRSVGLTTHQEQGSIRVAIPLMLVYCAFFFVIALAFDGGAASREDVAFQLTMPGIEEEIFYRGILLFALDRAFTARVHWLGVDWGWGALLSSLAFGLAHAVGYSSGHFSFNGLMLAYTALPSFIAVWGRLRSGSLLFPILMHNAGNVLPTIL